MVKKETVFINLLKNDINVVIFLETDNAHAMPEMRKLFFELINRHSNYVPKI